MITTGSISREAATQIFDFLAESYPGRRTAIRSFTHESPEFVFWVDPDGRLLDAKRGHLQNPPPGHEWILKDEPDYGGFLRGRLARHLDDQVVVMYCRPETLEDDADAIRRLLSGLDQMPLPIGDDALVISDNGDIYGTVTDLCDRLCALV